MNYEQDLEKVGRSLFPYYLVILFIAPIPFGSNRPWAWSFLAICALTLLSIYLWNYARKNLRPPELTIDIKIVFILLFSWLIYQILQLVPIPVEHLALLSSKTMELKSHSVNSAILSAYPLSFDLSASLHYIYKTVFYICIFMLTIFLVQSRDRLRLLILTFVFIGVVQAVLGLSFTFIQKIELAVGEPQDVLNVVKGTFINRNHFGSFINLCIASAIALLLASGLKEKRKIHRSNVDHHWQSRALDWRIYLIPYLGIMLLALFLSESRGAIISCAAMFMVLFGCLMLMKIGVDEIYNSFKFPLWLICFVIIFSGADVISDRLVMLSEDMALRMDHWSSSYRIFEDFKLFGIGSGSFQYVYPYYDTGFDKYRLLHAHNDYLELLAEQGIVGFTLLGLIVLICIKNAIKAIRRFVNLQQSAYAISSLIAICGFLIHSTMDFSFHIPSNAVYFFVFLAVALLQGMDSTHFEKREASWDEEVFESH